MPWGRSGCGPTLVELLPSRAGRKAASDRPAGARPVPWGQGHRGGSQNSLVIGGLGLGWWSLHSCSQSTHALLADWPAALGSKPDTFQMPRAAC